MFDISVIIPVYNVAKYLSKCLECVLNQTHKNIEIICINDCSTDNSLAVLQEYAKKDNRIKIINHEKNRGLSAARNTGLDAATGEYVYFLDSDDWIDVDYLEKMYDAAITSKSEVVLNTNIMMVDEVTNVSTCFWPEVTPSEFNHCFVDAKNSISKLLWSACIHLWKRSFLEKNNLTFPEGYVNEDEYFQAIAYMYLDKLYVIRDSAYYYLKRKNSICDTLKNRQNNIFSHLDIYEKICDEYEKRNFSIQCNFHFFTGAFFDLNYLENRECLYKNIRTFVQKRADFFMLNKEIYTPLELEFIEAILCDNKAKIFSPYFRGKAMVSAIKRNYKK